MNGPIGERSKIRAAHLERTAFVYVRQSSLRQVWTCRPPPDEGHHRLLSSGEPYIAYDRGDGRNGARHPLTHCCRVTDAHR